MRKCIYSKYILTRGKVVMKTNSVKGTNRGTNRGTIRATTRTFKSGNSIAMRIPHEFNLQAGKTFEIKRRGRELVLVEQEETLAGLIGILQSFPADFFADGRDDPPPTPVMSFGHDEAPLPLLKRTAKSAKKPLKVSSRQAK